MSSIPWEPFNYKLQVFCQLNWTKPNMLFRGFRTNQILLYQIFLEYRRHWKCFLRFWDFCRTEYLMDYFTNCCFEAFLNPRGFQCYGAGWLFWTILSYSFTSACVSIFKHHFWGSFFSDYEDNVCSWGKNGN